MERFSHSNFFKVFPSSVTTHTWSYVSYTENEWFSNFIAVNSNFFQILTYYIPLDREVYYLQFSLHYSFHVICGYKLQGEKHFLYNKIRNVFLKKGISQCSSIFLYLTTTFVTFMMVCFYYRSLKPKLKKFIST